MSGHGTIARYCKQKCRCSECREAWRSYMRAYKEKNRDRIRELNAARYQRNKHRVAELNRKWRGDNRERYRATSRVWAARQRAANPEKARTASRAWRLAHLEESRAACRAYRAKESSRRKHVAYQQKREALKANAAGAWYTTPEHIEARWAMYGGNCRYCGELATTTDHRIPISRGGSHWPSNLVPACVHCNGSKHTKTEAEFLERERVAA